MHTLFFTVKCSLNLTIEYSQIVGYRYVCTIVIGMFIRVQNVEKVVVNCFVSKS